MLKLKLQYFGHLIWKVDSLEKTLLLGEIGGRGEGDNRGWDGWMASLTQWAWGWVNSGSLWWTGRPGVLQFMGWQRVRHDWATELNWTELGHSTCEVFIFHFCCSVARSYLTLCDPMDCNMPCFPALRYLLGFAQTHVHWVGDAIQPSPLFSPSPPAFNLSQHQGLFQWVSSSHQVTKVSEVKLQHQSFQWIFRVDFL